MSAIAYLQRHPYSTAILSVGLSLLLMLALDPLASMTKTPFILFFGAVVVSAWQGGIRSGLVATGLAVLISNYFFLEPRYFPSLDPSSGVRQAVFVLECILISILCGSLRTTNQRLDRNLLKLQASEESLRTANQSITDILESITDGFFTLDRQWRFAYVNTQAEKILGLSPDTLLGQSVWEKFPQVKGTIFENNIYHAVNTQAPVVFEFYGIINLEQWFEVHINPLSDGLAVYFHDVSERKEAEDALRLSENRYRTLANAVSQLMWMNDAEGNIQFFNQRWQEYTGIADLELGVGLWDNVIYPDDFQPTLEKRSRAIQAGEAYEVECRLKGFDETYRWHLARIVPLKDENGQVIQWYGTAMDIHEVKQTEAALRESEAMARARAEELEIFMEAVPAAVWIAHDPQCQQITANRAAYQLVELPLGAVATATPADEVYPFPFKIHKNGQDIPLHDLPMQKAGRTGQDIEDEFDFVFDNGKIRSIWGRAVPLHGDNGEVRGVIGAFLDISERKQAEVALRESEERFRTLADNIAQFAWMADEKGWIFWYNYRWFDYTGTTLAEMAGWGWQKVHHPDHVERVVEKFRTCVEMGETWEDTFPLRGKDGQYRWFLSRAISVRDETGKVLRWFGTNTDITDRLEAEQERERFLERERAARKEAETANRLKDEFLAVLSHELRSPLNPILGWSKLLRTGKLDAAKTAKALETIERNAKLQTQLIEDLLDVSRILQGKLSLNMAPVNLALTIEGALETVRLAAQAKSIQIQMVFDPTIGKVLGDSARLQQVVWNLLSNAVKFTPEGGQVDIQLERAGSQAQIQVRDTGKGIPQDFLVHVFEYFRQADSTTTRKFGGLGLGLAIVRHLVELHGGTVEADSPGEGQGATFTVRLPLMRVPSETPQDNPPGTSVAHLTGLRILVVDDEPDVRELVAFILEEAGATVSVATSAMEALNLIEQSLPDVLVCDIGMPKMDGYMFMRQLRTLSPEQGGQIVAIALTAYAGEHDQQQALAAGFQQHLSKPVEPEELVRAIAALMNQ
ncbi:MULTISPECIES: PAS domain S-box protein [unclassified Coleofasciculus]|uniref:hybrid sensor histidine kinase/response regulator n=1 Tax=unclassified Coleofasciculus TaxID=2692782 RepID=UPI00188216DC|nr:MULTISPECIES: PAS domain S-box protein [unclassified Coleofasciculus]MBE9127132.1 PAS domain S-box protein [Coleofasciculus sp. LEGE 07081]MBE9149761.1 PAS domain S-box protein [Coleofasciculus sp. LEGE 07092]